MERRTCAKRPLVALLLCVLLGACERAPPPAGRAGQPAQARAAHADDERLRTQRHAGAEWRTFALDLHDVELTLVGQKPGEPHTFAALEAWLAGRVLVMATNAGIFDPNRRPLGLHVQAGEVLSPLSTAAGEGNFFLKPNGVFWVDERGAHVSATEDYAPQGKVELATQSGPLLVRKGSIHPAFREPSTSLRTRSGVGVDPRGRVLIALSLSPVSFFAMATLFRDVLHGRALSRRRNLGPAGKGPARAARPCVRRPPRGHAASTQVTVGLSAARE